MGDSPLARTVAQSRLDGSKTIITPKEFYEMLVRLGKHIDPSRKIDNQGTQEVKSTSRVARTSQKKTEQLYRPENKRHQHRRTLQQRGNHTNRQQKEGNSVLVYSTSTLGEPAQGNVKNEVVDNKDPQSNHSKGKRYGRKDKGKKGREKRRPAQPSPSDSRRVGVDLATRRAAKAAARYSR